MYEPMGNEEFATAYSETHTKCAGCGTSVLLPDMTDENGDYQSYLCSCGAVNCADCLDVSNGQCGGLSCDRNADREER